MFPFSQLPGTSPDCHDFSNITEEGLATTSASSLRTLGCILSGMYVQVPQVVTNLIFTYSERVFAPPVPVLQSTDSRGVGKDWQWRWWPKSCGVSQPSLCLLLLVCQSCSSGWVWLFWPSLSGWHTCRSHSYYAYHPLPCSAPAAPWPS